AEVGSAFLMGKLGMAPEPRPDHAAYISGWVALLKKDPRAIFTAAGKAQEAVEWLQGQDEAARGGGGRLEGRGRGTVREFIGRRVDAAEAALRGYGSGEGQAARLEDFLSDARHWCDRHKVHFGDVLKRAVERYGAEVRELGLEEVLQERAQAKEEGRGR